MMLERTGSNYTIKATGNFFRVPDTMIGDWVKISAPLIGERLLQHIRNHKNQQQIVTLKDNPIRTLSGGMQFYN